MNTTLMSQNQAGLKMILAPENCGCPLQEGGVTLTNSPRCSGVFLFMVLLEKFLKGRCAIADPCKRVQSVDEVEQEYDFIVVGAGTAGSIVAGRLSEVHSFKVLLLEAGGPEPIGARVPSFYRTFASNAEVDWRYRTVPADYCLDQGGRGCSWARGKVLGGSSVLNGMMYHRGHVADFEDWVNAGAKGWSWEENLPYILKTEGNKQIGSVVSEKYHSASGPLPIQQFRYQPPFLYELLNAVNETGFPIIADMNDPNTPEGFTVAQTFSDNGQRYTTARAYLKPKNERPNLSVKLNSHVTKVLFDGHVAYGVEFVDETGQKKIVHATKEVILSAGALNSPHILLLSGVGPKDTLEQFDIPIVANLPVGQYMKNHVGINLNFLLTKLENVASLDWSVLTEYLLEFTGPMTSTGISQLTGMLYSSLADKSRKQPDIQVFFNGFYAECSKTGVIGELCDYPTEGLNISANAAALLPRSEGFLTLRSVDPFDPPLFYPQYLTHPDDMVLVKDGARYLQKIYQSQLLQEKYGIKLDPDYTSGCSKAGAEWSDSWLECMARLHTNGQNHQLSTAAIAKVVDTNLKVYGITGLRIIDASVIPMPPTGNPQATVMMVAERGAEFIKRDWQAQ